MTFQEKRSLVYVFSTLLIIGSYCIYVLQMDQANPLAFTENLSFWGAVVLLLIPVQIVVNIVTHIIFGIVNTVATKEDMPTVSDERDRSVELKATRNSFYIFLFGFLLSMGTLVMNMSLYTMFNVLVFSLFAAQIVWSGTQFYFYRRGF